MAPTADAPPPEVTPPSADAPPQNSVHFEGSDTHPAPDTPSRRSTRRSGGDTCHLCDDKERQVPVPQQPPSSDGQSAPPAEHKPGHKHTPSMDAKGHLLVYDPDTFEEPAHGFAGRVVKRLGIFAYALFFVVPLVFVSVFFAIIPLGDPLNPEIGSQGVFIFVSNAAVTLAFAYLYNATFLMCARVEKPFRTSVIPLAAVLVVQISFMCAVLLTHGVFDWLGLVALALVYITLFVSMYLAYRDLRAVVVSFFFRFMLLLVLFIPILVGFVIAYRETDNGALQSFISFMFTFIIFVYRRVMLSRLDPFPLEVSQLLSGFWVQNLGDMATILAFPQVRSPKVFAAIFIANFLSNLFFLGFVSDPWIYKLRPTLKTYVLNGLRCNFPIPPIPEPDESFDPVNRGHDPNVGGYRRRQFRFFFFRLLSQAVAMTTYLVISPMLRYGLNKEFTPLAGYGGDEYRNSMIYAAANLVFIGVVAVLGYWFLNKRHHQTFHEIKEIHRHDLVHHTWVGLVTAIITHNMIMVIAIILSQYCVFASFQGCELAPLE